MAGYYAGSGDQARSAGAGNGLQRRPRLAAAGLAACRISGRRFETYTWTGNKEIAAALTTLFAKDGGGKSTAQGVLEPVPPDARHEAGGRGQRSRRAFPRKHDALGAGLPVDRRPRVPRGGPRLARPARTRRHAALRRARLRRVLRADRRVPGNRDLRRGRLPVEPDRPAHRQRRRAHGGPGGAGVLQRRSGHRRRAISRPTSISRVPTASSTAPRPVPTGRARRGARTRRSTARCAARPP